MSAPSLTMTALDALKPCDRDGQRVRALLTATGATEWTAADARAAGCTFDDLVWIASAVARTDKAVERRVRLWMADCAAHVLHLFERERPDDSRVRGAIIAARQFANGEIDDAAWDAARDAARAAALDAARDAAWDAARAAARAAGWTAAWTAAWDAAWAAARVAARDAARAAARAAGWTAAWDAAWNAAWAAEEAWQFDRLIEWLSDDEPALVEMAA